MNESTGKLILRLVLGVTILLHGIHKLTGGVDPIAGMLANAGLPAFLKYGPYVGEVLAPLAVIAGFYSRIGGWLIANYADNLSIPNLDARYSYVSWNMRDAIAGARQRGRVSAEPMMSFWISVVPS